MKTLVTLCLACLVQHAVAQITENDLRNMNIKGNVTSLVENRYRTTQKEGKPEKGSLDTKVQYIFNLKGYLAQVTYYNENGTMHSKISYVYDDNGNITEETSYKADGYSVSSTVYKNDVPNKKRERIRFYTSGTKIDNSIEQFDAQKRLIERQSHDATDKTTSLKITYKYDAKGNLTKITRFTEKFGVMSELTYKYDEKGNATEEINTSFKTKSTQVEFVEKSFYTYKYDEKGNWISKTCYDSDAKDMNAIIERTIVY